MALVSNATAARGDVGVLADDNATALLWHWPATLLQLAAMLECWPATMLWHCCGAGRQRYCSSRRCYGAGRWRCYNIATALADNVVAARGNRLDLTVLLR
jgi:hypothetical protein